MKQTSFTIFLLRLLAFLLVLIIIDQTIGWVLQKMYFSQRKGLLAQTTYAIDSANQDILIFGSSKAYRQYSPKIISEGSSLSCYNLGHDAQKIAYCTALEEVTLKRLQPKLIILDILPKELYEDDLKYSKLWVLLPYCKQHPEFIKYIEELSPFEKNKLYFSTLPYNSFLFLMINNLLLEKYVKKDELGYKPYTNTITKKEFDTYLKKKELYDAKVKSEGSLALDPKSVDYFKQFLDRATKDSIKTMVVISPSLLTEPAIYRNKIREICAGYPNVQFVDFSDNPKYSHHNEKFADLNHLNKMGAEEFSRELTILLNEVF